MPKIVDSARLAEAHRRMNEQAAQHANDNGARGIQARMVPVFQAFQEALAVEYDRKSLPADMIPAGLMTLAHCLGALVVNTVEPAHQPHVMARMFFDLVTKTKMVVDQMNSDAIANDVSIEASLN